MFNLPKNFQVVFSNNVGYVQTANQFVLKLVTCESGGVDVMAGNVTGSIKPEFFWPVNACEEEMLIEPHQPVTCYSSVEEMYQQLPSLLTQLVFNI